MKALKFSLVSNRFLAFAKIFFLMYQVLKKLATMFLKMSTTSNNNNSQFVTITYAFLRKFIEKFS